MILYSTTRMRYCLIQYRLHKRILRRAKNVLAEITSNPYVLAMTRSDLMCNHDDRSLLAHASCIGGQERASIST